MAANMKSVKLRIKSIQNTMQITKAMELVASSKLRRAKERAENRPVVVRGFVRGVGRVPAPRVCNQTVLIRASHGFPSFT